MLRPGFELISRSLRSSLATPARVAASNAAPRLAAPRSLSTSSSPFLVAARAAFRSAKPAQTSATPSPLQQQLRGVRTSPFRPGQDQSRAKALAISLPHSAPDPGAPTSINAPGGWARVLTSVGIVAGTALAAHLFFNRSQREHPLDAFSRQYLNDTFKYLAGGLTLVAGGAYALHSSGFSRRLMMTSPWVVLGVGLVASIGGMIGATSLEPGSPAKYACWALFNASQAAVLSPLLFFSPALLARAGLYTAGIVGSLCYIGATAKEGQYLWLGGPLLAGVTVVALSSISSMLLPATAFRALAATEAISLYGGLAVFSGFVLYDSQKILNHARLAQAGAVRPDPLRESISLELDAINIFVRLVTILASGGNNRKR